LLPELELLAGRVPGHARHVLVTGEHAAALAAALAGRPGVDVRTCSTATPVNDPPLPAGRQTDCIVMNWPSGGRPDGAAALGRLVSHLSADGCVLFRALNRAYCRGDGERGLSRDEAERILIDAGLAAYTEWSHVDEQARDQSRDAAECENAFAIEFTLLAVFPTYNPVEHAHSLFKAGHADWCYGVLELIPPAYLERPEVAAAVYSDMQLCLAFTSRQEGQGDVLRRFFEAQVLFYRVVSRMPLHAEAYHTQAAFWSRIGNPAMGLRLLQSLHHVAPDDRTAQAIDTWPVSVAPPEEPETPPPWAPERFTPRVLMIMTAGRPHFGMDILYDGLRSVLGDDGVVEFPWKPTLHGQGPKEQANYPCLFDHPGELLDVEALAAQLRAGRFDLMLFCDLEQETARDDVRALLAAAGDVPLFIVDAQDDPVDNRPEALDHLGRASCRGYFKREMLACCRYGPRAYPLPFAYPDAQAPPDVSGPRDRAVFWAGHRRFGLRRLYLERVEALLGGALDTHYAPEAYLQAVRSSRIGINIFGFGYDTVRYWELPAHGCMLLSERLPIRIPHNFSDGVSAVFFDDTRDLEDKLRHYLAHPDQAAAIAAAGHAHLRQHHTASARARQLLGWVLRPN